MDDLQMVRIVQCANGTSGDAANVPAPAVAEIRAAV